MSDPRVGCRPAYLDALSVISRRSFLSFRTAISFAFASTSTVASRSIQEIGEITHVDEIVVPFGSRSVPPFKRAGDVKERLPVPRRDRLLGGFLFAELIPMAAVVMHVVDERQPLGAAERQQIRWREDLVIVLDRQPAPGPGRQSLQVPGKIAEGFPLIAVSPAAVDVHHVGPHPLGDLGLVLQLPDRRLHYLRTESSSER